jgi:hypothetical protein
MKTSKVNTKSFDSFFSFVSKAVIIIPIVILILSLLFKFNQTNKPVSSVQLISPTSTPTSKLKIDFNGPLVCRYKNNNQEYDLFVKNRKVNLEIKAAGQTKKYDLSSYLSLVEGMINSGSTNLDSLASQYLGKSVNVEALYKESCKKEDF